MLDPELTKILYFPSNGITFQPETDDRPITFDQVEEIKYRTQAAGRYFDGNNELVTKHIYNKLRVVFCAQRIDDIPREHYAAALDLIEQANEQLTDFRYFIWDLQKQFAEKILRNGDPWTASIKAGWRKKLARKLPGRPDWQALANEIIKTSRGINHD